MTAIPLTPFALATALFDVDGTLIDSNDAHAETWTQALREDGVQVECPAVRRLIGMGSDKLLPAIAGIDHESARGVALAKRKKELFAERLSSLQPTRGARALLEFLRERHVELVVATSGDERDMNKLLEQAGVDDLIPKRTSKDDAEDSKPDPDIVHAAMSRAGAQAHTTVMIGDTPYDIEAAGRAGVRAIALRCGGYWSDADLHGAREIADDPAALLLHLRDQYAFLP